MNSGTNHNWLTRITISAAALLIVYLLSFGPYLRYYGGGPISAVYRPAEAIILSPVGEPYRLYMDWWGIHF